MNADWLTNERCVIIHADDFGMCHTTNRAILQLLDEKAISATTLMVNCPWSIEAARAAAKRPDFDVGVHLTLTSEWRDYKWGPIVRDGSVASLVNEYGHFPAASEDQREADPEQVRREVTAQIETAMRMGVDPTHLDNHMGTMRYFMDIHLEVCAKYRLPLRYRANGSAEGQQIAKRVKELGLLHPEAVVGLPFFLQPEDTYETTRANAVRILRELRPGVTEIVFHPSLDTEELQAVTDTWQARRYEFDVFRDPAVQAVIREEGIRVIGWRELRDLQRGG